MKILYELNKSSFLTERCAFIYILIRQMYLLFDPARAMTIDTVVEELCINAVARIPIINPATGLDKTSFSLNIFAFASPNGNQERHLIISIFHISKRCSHQAKKKKIRFAINIFDSIFICLPPRSWNASVRNPRAQIKKYTDTSKMTVFTKIEIRSLARCVIDNSVTKTNRQIMFDKL